MIKKKIIIVGGNAAGPSAAAKAKRVNPNADVIMYEASDFISTGTCELPYLISGDIDDYRKIVFFDENSFLEKKGVSVYTKHLVTDIDRRRKTISVKNLNTKSEEIVKYDKLILCTGSTSKRIKSIDDNIENIFYLKSVSDFLKIKNYYTNKDVRNVLIIGASYIGLEVADAFKTSGKNVKLLDSQDSPMPNGEKEIQERVKETLTENKVEFIGNASNVNYEVENNFIIKFELNRIERNIDLVIASIGFAPNTSLAMKAGLGIGVTGGIKVDTKQRTSDPNIFAAGDNCEVINKLSNRPDYIPLATFAHKQGHIAGANAVGGFEYSPPVVKNVAMKVFDKIYSSVGLTEKEAKKMFPMAKSVTGNAYNIIEVMPNSGKVFGKIIFNSSTKLIYGASFYGTGEVIGYADIISTFIENKIKASKLTEMSFNYTPPHSPFMNLLSLLGREIG